MPLFNFKIKESAKEWDEITAHNFYADDKSDAREIAVMMSQDARKEIRYNESGSNQGYYVRAYDEQKITGPVFRKMIK